MSNAVADMDNDLVDIYGHKAMRLHDLKQLRRRCAAQLKLWAEFKANCQNCTRLQNNVCTKYEAVPPPEFRSTDSQCPEWLWDGIPY